MNRPQWKRRQIAEKSERERAERQARYDAFWAAVEKPRLIEDQPDTFVLPLDYDAGLPIG